MANNRILWAVQAVGFRVNGSTGVYTPAHGVQSVGITTTFNLEQVFELGQISIYENIENIPDVEVTAEKVLDGYPLLYHLATPGATSASLVGRSGARCGVALSIFNDTFDSASGDALATVEMSGMYVSSLSYTMPVEGNCTESLSLVGNHKVWAQGGGSIFEGTLFDNSDQPFAYPDSGGVQRRENVLFNYTYGAVDVNGQVTGDGTILPQDVAGISTSGTNDLDDVNRAHLQNITVSTDLGREAINELGRKSPYFRYVQFPVEVTCDIEIIATSGDWVSATEAGVAGNGNNLSNRTIQIEMQDTTKIHLGTQNKLSNVVYAGGGTDGANATVTYSYVTQNDMTVTHTNDPAGL